MLQVHTSANPLETYCVPVFSVYWAVHCLVIPRFQCTTVWFTFHIVLSC